MARRLAWLKRPPRSGQVGPLVSVVLTTRDRPSLLPIALACYAHQSYRRRELIVVDDGERYPADPALIASAGGQLVRLPPGTALGEKLNAGLQQAQGQLAQKMDDDDWYGPRFLETMLAALAASQRIVCRPTIAFLRPFLFFDLAGWEIRRSEPFNVPGATLLFGRDDWQDCPFRPLPGDEDFWFLHDQTRRGVTPLPVDGLETFLAVRHAISAIDRGHTWTHQADGQTLEQHLRDRPQHRRRPEQLLPAWAVAAYRSMS